MSGKWSSIVKEDVVQAIRNYEEQGESAFSKNTFLKYEGKLYPAKHLRALAYEVAYGTPISKSKFNGGMETVRFFERLGFEMTYTGGSSSKKSKLKKVVKKESKKRSVINQKNVIAQKNELQKHLNRFFHGDVVCEKTYDWLKTPNRYDQNPEYEKLTGALISFRGHADLGKTNYKLRCDFVCESEKVIIEYDERQHFTEARHVSLLNYPETLSLQFDKASWIESCVDICAKDNHPPNRDEVRAFYDSVRDIEAARNGYQLIRIRHGDFDWSRLDGEGQINRLTNGKESVGKIGVANSKLLDYDWRSLEVELQRIRLQYLKWLYRFRPQPCDALGAMKENGKIFVVGSPYGRSFSLSPAGIGKVYVGGGKGVKGLSPACYEADDELLEETERIKKSLDKKVSLLRRKIQVLLNAKEYSSVWEYIQNFWWLRLGIHEFVHDVCFKKSPLPTHDVREYVLVATYQKIDLSKDIPTCFSDEQIMHSLRYTFSWNRYANCSYDCGPMALGMNGFVPYSKAAKEIITFFDAHGDVVPDLNSNNEKRDFAAASLSDSYDFLLLYHREPMGFWTIDQFDSHKEGLREIICEIEEKIERIALKEELDIG